MRAPHGPLAFLHEGLGRVDAGALAKVSGALDAAARGAELDPYAPAPICTEGGAWRHRLGG